MCAEGGFVGGVGGFDVDGEGAALDDVEEVALVALGDDLGVLLAYVPPHSSTISCAPIETVGFELLHIPLYS